MGSQSNPGSNHVPTNGEQKSETFVVVDLQNFGNAFMDNETTTTTTATINHSRITTLQRSLSRKVTTNRGENTTNTLFASSSPKASQLGSNNSSSSSISGGGGTPQKSGSSPVVSTATMGSTTDNEQQHENPAVKPLTPQQHQITIKTGGTIPAPGPVHGDKRWMRRSLSLRRSSQSWFSDPRKVVVLFATLSIIGTMSLIYFTLTMSKPGGQNDDGLD